MKYINKFNSVADALACPGLLTPQLVLVNDEIVSAPITLGEEITIKQEGGKLVPEKKSNEIEFTVIFYLNNNSYVEGEEKPGPIYIEHALPGMTFSQFIDSDFNPIVNGVKRYTHMDMGLIWYGFLKPTISFSEGDEYYGNDFISENTVIEAGVTYPYLEVTTCLLGDTEVTMADGSLKQIKDIELGDEVLSLDLTTGEQVSRKVIYTNKNINKTTIEWDEWEFSDGTIIKTAHRHEFYNVEAGQFKYLDEWQIGEHTYKIDETTPELVKHTVHKEEVNHYKITLENSNNFFANGLLNGDRYCNNLDIQIIK